ncbi:MAG TPA: NAD(P)-dependent alcohol dehydrogenase [candidate division Zixibacteria bacterium]|nr:NAD(P)-dependent alcohol dehydrogenase [candidate division Zixibacteria bacterium]
MKAVVRERYGSPDVLEYKEIDRPEPADNQVLVKVHAASLNALDWHVLRGEPFLVRLFGFGLFKPKHRILGADVAGRVEAIGAEVSRFKVGDEVIASGMGGFAEYTCFRERTIAPKPASISFEQAAALPVAGITALQALRDKGKIQPGQHVLVNGASGGVGTYAVQIAKALGAKVTGVCSTRNVEMVRSIGADHVIDYSKEQFWQNESEYDLVADAAAFYPVSRSLRALKPGGRYVLIGGSADLISLIQGMVMNPIIAKMKGKHVASFIADVNQSDLEFLGRFLEEGKITSVIDRKYPLRETAAATRYMEEEHVRGKVIIEIVQPDSY